MSVFVIKDKGGRYFGGRAGGRFVWEDSQRRARRGEAARAQEVLNILLDRSSLLEAGETEEQQRECAGYAPRIVRLKPRTQTSEARKTRTEYETTHHLWEYRALRKGNEDPPAPYEPSGAGWTMVGLAATEDQGGGVVFWFWKRETLVDVAPQKEDT